MKNKSLKSEITNMALYIILFIIPIVFSLLKLSSLTVISSILASLFLLYNVKKIVGNYMSVSFFFTAFHILYGLSGPISVVWLNGLTATYGGVYNIFPYMIAYSLTSICYYVGFYFYSKRHSRKTVECECQDIDNKSAVENDKFRKYFLFVAECGLLIAVVFELINFFRVGGFPTVLRGKAIYQAAVDELKYTLPSSEIVHVSIAALCTYLFISLKKQLRISKKTLICLFIMMIPYLVLLLFLGKRGNILTVIMIIVVALFQYKPMKKISRKFVIWIMIIYFVMGSMFAIRGYTGLLFKNFNQFTEKVLNKDNLISAFNPGQNEFGCAFGNFNKLYLADDYEFLYGSSYLKGLTHFIPSYLYPGTKPQLLMYQFRDKYFPFKAEISSIAGTAFSSILETYWNFGFCGALIYCIYGVVIAYLEFVLKKKSMFKFLYYLTFIPYIYEFHRSDFGHISFGILLNSFMVIFVFLFYKYVFKKSRIINKAIDVITNPNKIVISMMNKRLFNWISDEKYLKLRYRMVFGKKLDLNNPKEFNAKLQWLKLYDRNEKYVQLVDKIAVKDYVSKLIGKEYLIETLGVYDKFDDINFSKLPNQFVIKCSHDSGGLCICKNKKSFEKAKARKKIEKCLSSNYYYLCREWPYKEVKPRIIVEKYMEDKKSFELIDYKVLCFNGIPKMIFTCTDRYSDGLKVTFFDLDWNKLPFERHYPSSKKDIKKPKNLKKMIELSKKMAKDIPFVRIDWYEINGKLYFGEYTFYPGSGFEEFTPEEWDEKMGEMIKLPK